MRTLTKEELQEILNRHNHWCFKDCTGWENMKADLSNVNLEYVDLKYVDLKNVDLSGSNLSGADMSGANLSGADLSGANLSDANLCGANLSDANLKNTDLRWVNLGRAVLSDADLSGANLKNTRLRYADLSGADLKNTDLYYADLSGANLSGAKNILSSIDYLKENFEVTSDGIIAYKVFNGSYAPPKKWVIQSGSIITENCNPNRADICGCGINVAPLKYIEDEYEGDIWKILIRWEWLVGVVVPYNTDGRIRCEKCELVEIVDKKEN